VLGNPAPLGTGSIGSTKFDLPEVQHASVNDCFVRSMHPVLRGDPYIPRLSATDGDQGDFR
jgi:hypothetical protein